MCTDMSLHFSKICNILKGYSFAVIIGRVKRELNKIWGKPYHEFLQEKFPCNPNHLLTIAKWSAIYSTKNQHESKKLSDARWAYLYNLIVDFPRSEEVLAAPENLLLNRILLSNLGKQYPFQLFGITGLFWYVIAYNIFVKYVNSDSSQVWAQQANFSSLEDFLCIHLVVSTSIMGAAINFDIKKDHWGNSEYVKKYLGLFSNDQKAFSCKAKEDHQKVLENGNCKNEYDDPSFFLRLPFMIDNKGMIGCWQQHLMNYFLGSMPYDFFRSIQPSDEAKAIYGRTVGSAFEAFVHDETRNAFKDSYWNEDTLAHELKITNREKRPDFAISTQKYLCIAECKAGSMPRFGYESWDSKEMRKSFNSTVAKAIIQLCNALEKADALFPDKICIGLAITYHHSVLGLDIIALCEDLFFANERELFLSRKFAKRISICNIVEYLNYIDKNKSDINNMFNFSSSESHFIIDGHEVSKERIQSITNELEIIKKRCEYVLGFRPKR